jgi:Phage integrase, N-terminal SAM-like domain
MTTEAITPLRQRMIEDMNSRKLCAHTQRGHIYSCKRFAAFLKRSPETATCEDIRLFQLHLAETGMSICNRNRIMTGVRFLFRVTLRRIDIAAEIYHHGFRSTFKTWAAERTNFPREVVEAALAHAIGDKVEAAYQRGDLFDKRRRLMIAWEGFATAVPSAPAAVVPIGQGRSS